MEQQQEAPPPPAFAFEAQGGPAARAAPAPARRAAGGPRRVGRRASAAPTRAAANAPDNGANASANAEADAAMRASSLSPPPMPPRVEPRPLREVVEEAFAQMRAARNDPERLLRVRQGTIRMLDDRLAQIEEEEDLLRLHQEAVRATYIKSRVEMQLRMASVLNEAILVAESPASGWGEVQSLTKTRTTAEAKAVASQLIGFAVAWRVCLRMRPAIFDELCDSEFSIEDLCVTARAGVALTLEVVDAATGAATPREARVTLVDGFCFSKAVDEAIKRGAPRRAEEARKKIALYTAVHQAMQRRRNSGVQLPTDPTAPILDEHLRSMLSRETIEDVEGQPSTSGRA